MRDGVWREEVTEISLEAAPDSGNGGGGGLTILRGP